MRDLNVFVAATGNAFMNDIAGWIAEAGTELGRASRLVDDGSPPADGDAINLVVAPHEFYLLANFDDSTIHRAAQVSVPVCTEQPGTPWFEIGLVTARTSPLALDINRHGVDALRGEGIDARHLGLGGVSSMIAPDRGRDLDLLFLGGKTDRRGGRLAGLAPVLWDRDVDLRLFSFSRPVRSGAPGLVFGADKYELLARARILLNIHRDDVRPGDFEWARMVEAMANGCCVVTEPVTGCAPFEEGVHFVATDDLEGVVAELLADDERCRAIGEAARRAVIEEHSLSRSLAPILDALDGSGPRTVTSTRRPPRYRRRMILAQQHPLLPAFRPHHEIRSRLYRALIDETALRRRIEGTRSLLRHGVDDHVQLTPSVAYTGVSPQVSVIVTLFDYGHLISETLASVAASTGVELEIIVVDDHSTDDGRAVVTRYIDEHPELAVLLVGSEANRGLPAARNLGFDYVRADRVMVMDADNLVYPNAVERLSAALDADPSAAFAYSTLEEFGVTSGVRSAMAWNVQRLCESNYIDAQAMIRADAWDRHGGYPTDPELTFGWEDWAFWLRLAAGGEHGVHVAQMLGRYRTQRESMISTTNLVADQMVDHLRSVHPDLPWPTD